MIFNDDELDNRFTYHPPANEKTIQTHEAIRRKARELARWLNETLPDSQEAKTAINRLDDVVFFSNAAVARHGLQAVQQRVVARDDIKFSTFHAQEPPRVILQAFHRPTGVYGQATREMNRLWEAGYDATKDFDFVQDAVDDLKVNLQAQEARDD